ncbi:hypothetical protein CHLV4142_09815 [Campylobacter helveticus]|uniref:Uncharacterized protein n=1 Tax=Campylobacter helveticus TaxID=28898 RepID=A0ABY3L3I0_9BACT|nr:hypothetical protein [Campylobacter helveticus]MCR2040437.1 hypothetical protein [Campylobacter helveticus]TXK59029.1 hypothetical protein FVD16_02205 [Campylobacter helveticus]
MKKSKDYYLKYQTQIKDFCKGLENKEYFILKCLYLSKEFKAYRKQNAMDSFIPSLFSKKDLEC